MQAKLKQNGKIVFQTTFMHCHYTQQQQHFGEKTVQNATKLKCCRHQHT